MAQFLYFSRDTKLYAEFNGTVFNIPVLDGYSFSQATNATEITLNEMEASGGGSRRGRRAFNASLAPGECPFQHMQDLLLLQRRQEQMVVGAAVMSFMRLKKFFGHQC